MSNRSRALRPASRLPLRVKGASGFADVAVLGQFRAIEVFDYDVAGAVTPLATPPWQVAQYPNHPGHLGTPQPARISIVTPANVPGSGQYKPLGSAMRVEVQPYESSLGADDGDVTVLGGSTYYSRAEVYGRSPTFQSSTPYDQWPDPAGSERWYGWSVYLPSDFTATVDTRFIVTTQWKGFAGNSPPVSIEIKRSNWRFGGERTNAGLIANDGTLAPIVKGAWARFVCGYKWSDDPAVGWAEVWLNGVNVLARQSLATMDTASGHPDPIYLKQGVYRDTLWDVTHVLHFGPCRVGHTKLDVESD